MFAEVRHHWGLDEAENYRAQFYNLVEHSGKNLTVRGDATELERRTNGITQKTNFVNGYAPIMASNAAGGHHVNDHFTARIYVFATHSQSGWN